MVLEMGSSRVGWEEKINCGGQNLRTSGKGHVQPRERKTAQGKWKTLTQGELC